MEFPELGEQCSVLSCKQLDFLPFKCDACNNIYCRRHYFYTSHDCPEAHSKNKLVPTCPLCNEPVPCKKNETVDEAVSRHIDDECSDDRARKKRNTVYSNKCSLKGCKQKEAIPLICESCKLNFCLKHRHQSDHKCERPSNQLRNANPAAKNAAAAAMERLMSKKNEPRKQTRNSQNSSVLKVQGTLSEEEALQRALEMSLSDGPRVESNNWSRRQEEEDRMLAKAIAESEKDYNANKGKCYVS